MFPTDRPAAPALVRLAATVLALGLVAAACSSGDDAVAPAPAPAAGSDDATGGDAGSGDGAAPSEDEASAAPTGPVLAPETFDGQATTVGGEPFELASLAGQDLVLWFWAPW